MCGNAAEGPCQFSDLIIPVILKCMIIFSFIDLFCCHCKLPEGPGDPSGKPENKEDEQCQKHGKGNDDQIDPFPHVSSDLTYRNGNI